MGSLAYDLPTLNTTGAQPATDIVDALTDIQTETNGNIETANLLDGGLGEDTLSVYGSYRYENLSRVTPGNSYTAQVLSFTVPECSFYTLHVSATMQTDLTTVRPILLLGKPVISSDLFSPILRTPTAPFTAGSISTLPGNSDGTVGIGGPLVIPWALAESQVKLGLWNAFIVGSSYIENVVVNVNTYKGF